MTQDLELANDMMEMLRRWFAHQRNECHANLKRLDFSGPEAEYWQAADNHLHAASDHLSDCISLIVRASSYLDKVR